MSLIIILDIIGALVFGALLAFFITYMVQRKKIDEMKKGFRAAIREEAKRSYKAGYDIASFELKEIRVREQEASYVVGYEDGVKNEQYFREKRAKHSLKEEHVAKNDDTAVIPFADLILLVTTNKEDAQL